MMSMQNILNHTGIIGDLADCKSFIMIDENWGAKDYRLGNAEQIKVKKLFRC